MPSNLKINSKNVTYTPHDIVSNFVYQTTKVDSEDGQVIVTPVDVNVTFKTKREPSKVGVMLIGWGGNNGSTFTGAYFANKHNISWSTKSGVKQPNWYGSMLQSSTVSLGFSENGEVFVPMRDLIPMANPNNLFVDGWDISSHNLHESMQRAEVFDYDLQQKLAPYMSGLKPRPAIHCEDFVAANQSDRANNLLSGSAWDQVNTVRNDIKDFKAKHNLDKVIIIWTANTERFCEVMPGIHDTAENLIKSIKNDEEEISPSTLYAVASILEGCSYINGSPQNTFVPAVLDLAEKNNVFLGGDDLKSGQTKIKSVLVDFLVSAGIKPVSIVSYNHLGNNDGKNLSAPKQFRSKEITKSNVVDDMVESNQILYNVGEKPDHVVVIKYVPTVADSKRAMDEYTSEIFMHGTNTIVLHNTCEDSLLATPIILDLILLTELFERVQISVSGGEYQSFNSVLSLLSYLLKAPLVPEGAPVVNALFKQRAAIENVLRAMLSLPPQNHMTLEHRLADTSVFRKELKLPQIFKNNVHPTVHQKKHIANGHSLNGNNISLTNGTNGLVTNGNGYH